MARNRDSGRKQPKLRKEKSVSRRDFFKGGAAAGGAADFSFVANAHVTSINVWGLPSAAVAGELFRVTVGTKLSRLQARWQADKHLR